MLTPQQEQDLLGVPERYHAAVSFHLERHNAGQSHALLNDGTPVTSVAHVVTYIDEAAATIHQTATGVQLTPNQISKQTRADSSSRRQEVWNNYVVACQQRKARIAALKAEIKSAKVITAPNPLNPNHIAWLAWAREQRRACEAYIMSCAPPGSAADASVDALKVELATLLEAVPVRPDMTSI